MANPTPPPGGFYSEVDRFRHRNSWGCLFLLLVLVAVIIAVFWWVLQRG